MEIKITYHATEIVENISVEKIKYIDGLFIIDKLGGGFLVVDANEVKVEIE